MVVTNLAGSVTNFPAANLVVRLQRNLFLSAAGTNLLLQSTNYVGETIVVLWSSNLTTWASTGLTNRCSANGFYTLTLPKTNRAPEVFYRLRIY